MKTTDDLKAHCLAQMNIHRDLEKGSEAAGCPIGQSAHRGQITAYKDVHTLLSIWFCENKAKKEGD